MNAVSSLLGGENLDTYLLLILIFILLRSDDDSGMVFALGYLLLADAFQTLVQIGTNVIDGDDNA